jgi:oligopeptide transport system substrate-binding protein
MSNQQGDNRWLIGIVVILVIALVGALCVGIGAFFYLQQQPQAAAQNTPAAGKTAAPVTQSAPAGNTLRLPGAEPPSLDPALAGDADSAGYVAEIYSGLVTLDQNLKVVPDIAEKWDVSQDRKTYTFHLRQNVKFHNGQPLTAQDFKYSIERAADPVTASPTADTYLGDIVGVKDKLNRAAPDVKGVVVVDNYTLQITIDAPRTYFIAKLTFPTAFVVDKNNVEKGGRTWTDKPNGTGPYSLKEYVRGQRIVLVKNGSFYLDPKPSIDEVDYILGGGSAMTMYENGDLDAVPIGPNDVERVTDPASPLNKELTIAPQLSTFFVVFNTRKPPFDDPKVRQAFALSIDRQQIVDVVGKKMPVLANSILPPGMPGYVEPNTKIPYDPAKAKQLVADSKYAGKLPDITWTTTGGGGATAQDIQAMTAMLKSAIGVNVQIQQTDWASFIGQLNDPSKNPYQMFDIGWIGDYADPQDFMDVLFHTGSLQNWSAYSNPAVDKLLDQAGQESDVATRFKLYAQAEQMILADYPVVPTMHPRDYWLTKSYVKGLTFPPITIPKLRYVTFSK